MKSVDCVRKSTPLSLIVCRTIGGMVVVTAAWIYAHALARMFVGFVKPETGVRKNLPIAPVFTALMSAISNAGAGTRPSPSSRNWQSRLACRLANCSSRLNQLTFANLQMPISVADA